MRISKAFAMAQIATAQVVDDDDDDDDDGDDDDDDDDGDGGAVAAPVKKKRRVERTGSHKWIADDPAWTWASKKGKGRCECGCVVNKTWHTFNRQTKGK